MATATGDNEIFPPRLREAFRYGRSAGSSRKNLDDCGPRPGLLAARIRFMRRAWLRPDS
jgi:hypothetical protein